MSKYLYRDIQFALRRMRRAPLVSCVIVLALSAGIGLNVAVFAMIDDVWFRPPVSNNPHSFLQLLPKYSGWFSSEDQFPSFTARDYQAIYDRSRSLAEVAAWNAIGRVKLDNDVNTGDLLLVTCNYFDVYGFEHPLIGRFFLPDECAPSGAIPVVVLSHNLWRTRYSSDPGIVGKTIHINNAQYTVVGVSAAESSAWMRNALWIPYTMQPQIYKGNNAFQNSHWPWLTVVARLRQEYTRSDARSELNIILAEQDRLIPGRKTTLLLTNGSLFEDPAQRSLAWTVVPLILGPMILLLMVACTNVTILLLARAASRRKEIAVRLALGIGKAELLRFLAAEAFIAAALGGAISWYLSYKAPNLFWAYLLPQGQYGATKPDLVVFTYLTVVMVVAGFVAALAPVLDSMKIDVIASLLGRDNMRLHHIRSQSIFVGMQVAMSFVLLAGAATFWRLEWKISSVDPGFNTRQVLIVPIDIIDDSNIEEIVQSFYSNLSQKLQEVPGVRSIASASIVPFTRQPQMEIRSDGRAKGQGTNGSIEIVTANFFETLGIQLVRGRAFSDSDLSDRKSAAVAVVSQALSTALWGSENPVGKIVELPRSRRLVVIGVARDMRSERYGVVDGPRIYLLQSLGSIKGPLLLRFGGDAKLTAATVGSIVRNLSGSTDTVPRTVASIVDEKASQIGRLSAMVTFIACVALFLAMTGLYGMVAFITSERTREFGIRISLGATKEGIVLSVLTCTAKQVFVGLCGGILLAFPAAVLLKRLSENSPVETKVLDIPAYATTAFMLLTVALIASGASVLRSLRADPIDALRHE